MATGPRVSLGRLHTFTHCLWTYIHFYSALSMHEYVQAMAVGLTQPESASRVKCPVSRVRLSYLPYPPRYLLRVGS